MPSTFMCDFFTVKGGKISSSFSASANSIKLCLLKCLNAVKRTRIQNYCCLPLHHSQMAFGPFSMMEKCMVFSLSCLCLDSQMRVRDVVW